MTDDRIVRPREVEPITGISNSRRYELIANGTFPPGIQLGSKHAVGWFFYELRAINAARAAGKSDKQIRALVRRLVAKRKQAFLPFEA